MNRKTFLASLVAAALAPVAAPAVAAQVIETYTMPSTTYYVEPVTTTYVPATTTYYVAPASTETYTYYTAPRTYYYPTSSVREVYEAPPIVVEAPALTTDQAINNEVIDRLASNPRLSGRIGVETYDRNVELTGVVTTPRQSELAERDARGVIGVRSVQNDLRTRLSR
jgi:hypothetical protein